MTKLEVVATKYAEKNHSWLKDALPTLAAMKSFIKGAEWAEEHLNPYKDVIGHMSSNTYRMWKENLWHDAQGDDLPEIDREVIVLCDDGYGGYKVSFGHRPYKKGYIGKNLAAGNIETFYIQTYGKGGWNIPDVKWWLDCSLPNLEEE